VGSIPAPANSGRFSFIFLVGGEDFFPFFPFFI
jgi:hypothetical protein